MKENKISVLMGVYNCGSTVKDAVQSIQNQTYQNWELIICDDGSTDETNGIIQQLASQDSRIKAMRNEENAGLNVTLNKCLAVATGDYIARMDGDDLCSPERFQKQVDFLDYHKDFDIVSSAMTMFDENGTWGITIKKECPQAFDVVTGSPICHAPAMIRSECMNAVGGYSTDPKTLRVEDVDLWIRLYAAGYRCYNIQEPLYAMRNDRNAFARRKYKYRINSTITRLRGCRLLHLGLNGYLKAFHPMIIGLVPAGLRRLYRRRKNSI